MYLNILYYIFMMIIGLSNHNFVHNLTEIHFIHKILINNKYKQHNIITKDDIRMTLAELNMQHSCIFSFYLTFF